MVGPQGYISPTVLITKGPTYKKSKGLEVGIIDYLILWVEDHIQLGYTYSIITS